MLRKECALNEGLHQETSEIEGTESSENAPGLAAGSQAQLTIIPLGGGAGGAAGDAVESAGPPNTSSTTTHGENRSNDGPELDPHICRQWPCPQCHKPRDADDEMTPEAGQYSAEAATSTQSFFHPHESLQLERSKDSDDDLLLDIVAPSPAHGTQNHKSHYS